MYKHSWSWGRAERNHFQQTGFAEALDFGHTFNIYSHGIAGLAPLSGTDVGALVQG